MRAFHEIVQRFEALRAMELTQEEVSIEEKIEDIRRLFLVHNTLLFSTLFAEAQIEASSHSYLPGTAGVGAASRDLDLSEKGL